MRTTLGILCTLLLAWPSMGVGQDASAAIEESMQAWEVAYNAGDTEAVASAYTTDAVLYPPGAEPVQGREAIRAFWQQQMEEAGGNTIELETREVHELGDAAVAIGSAIVTDPDGGHVDHGSYLKVSKQVDGEWKIVRDIYNNNTSP